MVSPVRTKHNNFGALRLLFASLVIFSHSPSILTGNPSLEPRIGPLTLGEIGVDGFFLISGYLITKSFVESESLLDYLKRRVLRIYPGYLVNAALCVFVLAPLVGAGLTVFHPTDIVAVLARLSILNFPKVPGIFPSMPLPALNAPVWTIPYEFRCYVLVAMLGCLPAYQSRRAVILVVTLGCLTISALRILPEASGLTYIALGTPSQTVRLTGFFMTGMLFYLYRDSIAYNSRFALLSAFAFAASALVPPLTQFALATFGAYIVFWVALRIKVFAISKFSNETDLSYGIYLYAWPIQMVVAYCLHRSIDSVALSFTSLGAAAVLAYVSWTLIEKPALLLAHRKRPARSQEKYTSLPEQHTHSRTEVLTEIVQQVRSR